MCRSIKTLRGVTPASPDEVEAAALQFVRKISGYREPSPANERAFRRAVASITASSERLLGELPPKRPRPAGAAPAVSAQKQRVRPPVRPPTEG